MDPADLKGAMTHQGKLLIKSLIGKVPVPNGVQLRRMNGIRLLFSCAQQEMNGCHRCKHISLHVMDMQI